MGDPASPLAPQPIS
jgi:hypothetical protein